MCLLFQIFLVNLSPLGACGVVKASVIAEQSPGGMQLRNGKVIASGAVSYVGSAAAAAAAAAASCSVSDYDGYGTGCGWYGSISGDSESPCARLGLI